MNAKELSDYTKLSLQTIYNLVHTNQIPYRRISKKRVVFDLGEIDEWLKTRKRKIRQPKSVSPEEPNPGLLAKGASRDDKTTLTEVPPLRTSPLPPLPKPIIPHTLRPLYVRVATFFMLIAIGWGGGFLYFRYRTASVASRSPMEVRAEGASPSESRNPSHGVIDLGPLKEQAGPGRIDVRIPSTEKDKAEVHLDRISDFELQGEAASLIKPLLIQTLKNGSGDYAAKSKTIDIIRPYADDPKIREAIIYLVKNEKDPAIRLKAVTVLGKVADNEEAKDVLLDLLLNDENTGIRFKALEIIENNMDVKSSSVLKRVNEREPNENIRNKAKSIVDRFERNRA